MNKSFLAILPLLLNLHCSAAAAAISSPPFTSCSNSKTYISGDPYNPNLTNLMSLLLHEAPTIGFGLRATGHGSGRAFGLAMCRGDMPSSACTACIHEANDRLLHHCPFNREATAWLDHCLVRYADREFFGEIDGGRRCYVSDDRNVLQVPALGGWVEELMERLAKRAYLTPLLFETGEMELGGMGRLFGLVQCTRDLSGGDCKRCLDAAINELRSGGCGGGRGGGVAGGSCNLRYELYPFYESS